MKVIELIQEIEDILETAGGFPLTGKVMVDPEEIRDILKEIKQELPEEIQQAQWIKNERQRILDDAKTEYDRVITAANEKADELVENDEITLRAKKRADDIMRDTQQNVKELKLGTFKYIDDVLGSFQNNMSQLNEAYAQRIFTEMNGMFGKIDETISENRNEIRGLSYKTEEEG